MGGIGVEGNVMQGNSIREDGWRGNRMGGKGVAGKKREGKQGTVEREGSDYEGRRAEQTIQREVLRERERSRPGE